MPWNLDISKQALRDLVGLYVEDRNAVEAAIRRLAIDPSQGDFRKLQGGRGWRLRVGRWRVLIDLDTRTGVMHVARVQDRRDAYRG
jgi:mRNA-degrading endonuclease RelE of RelBE toxin-antitoxin system